MHPAISVLFFTTLSGAGYGLWFWLALWGLFGDRHGHASAFDFLAGLALGLVLVSVGLLSSLGHLGQPQRAWRAFSQWRSSWLSREGVLAMATFVPVTGLALPIAGLVLPEWLARVLLLWLALGALATVACTAMIYVSLRTIPAWSQPRVLPGYLLFALHTGGLLFATLAALAGGLGNMIGLAALLSSLALWWLKRGYWRNLDAAPAPDRARALGLPAGRGVHVFERPHTEANYLTKEMGFVLARKHARKLRVIAVLLFAAIPALFALPVWWFVHLEAAPWLCAAALAAYAGALVERWLFFAEAKHVVMAYY
jgi:DMSO reductase anchor subunit